MQVSRLSPKNDGIYEEIGSKMNDSTSKKADSYLTSGDSILAKIKELDELSRKVSFYLDDHLKDYCQVANLVSGKLVMIAANGSIATQIRFQTPDLLVKFKQDPLLKRIVDIHCKVSPPFASSRIKPATTHSRKVQPLSPETVEIMLKIAESLEDPALREVMKRIASHKKS